MTLMLRARLRAIRHLWQYSNFLRGHRISREERRFGFGFETVRVFCSCGEEFK